MQETYFLFNNKLNIPLNIFLTEKQKYLNYTCNTKEKKRYLYNTFEGIAYQNGIRECYNKYLKEHKINNNKLIVNWELKEVEWPQDIEWHETEEYLVKGGHLDLVGLEDKYLEDGSTLKAKDQIVRVWNVHVPKTTLNENDNKLF